MHLQRPYLGLRVALQPVPYVPGQAHCAQAVAAHPHALRQARQEREQVDALGDRLLRAAAQVGRTPAGSDRHPTAVPPVLRQDGRVATRGALTA
eukprot:1314650-Prymnesium_polylepis.1